MSHELIPDSIITLIEKNLTVEESTLVLDEIQNTIKLESVLPPLVDKGKTYGDWATSTMGVGAMFDNMPTEGLPLDIVKQMLKSAPVRFALEMKRASIVSVFRNKRSWKVHTPDAELAEIITANLQKILPKMALDFSFSSLAYGVSFQELVWESKNKYELGITNSKYQTNRKFVVAKIPNSVNPATVKQINRTKDGHFNGFVQRSVDIFGKDIVVPKDASLIIPYDEKFRNLWGESLLRPIYPIWVWYEIVLRSMVKYMERTGTPVAVVKAPSRATIFKPGTKEKVDGISWGMEIASNVSRSNAISIPSDTDDKGKPLWELEYLNSSERSQPFLDILELLTQMILRAGLSADRALSQSSGGTGSYAIGRVHQEATAIHNEMVLIQWIHYLNMYFLPLYSLYNRGENGPPVWLETQGLDPKDSENLATMLGIAQGMESFKEAGYRIDWNTLLEVNNIPLLTTADADAAKKKHQEEALSNQENMLSLQSKFSTPSPTKQSDGSLKANLPNKPPESKDDDSKKKLESEFLTSLDSVMLGNPYRDPRTGKFTSGGIAAMAGAGIAGYGVLLAGEGKALKYVVNKKVDKEFRNSVNPEKTIDDIRGDVLSSDILSTTIRGKKIGLTYDHVDRAGTLYGNVGAKAQDVGGRLWGGGTVAHRFQTAGAKATPGPFKARQGSPSDWPKAKQDSFKSMYRDLAKKYHPDVSKDPFSTSRMQDINSFYSSGNFSGIEDLFKKLETLFYLTDIDVAFYSIMLGVFTQFLESDEEYLVFDARGIENMPPFVIEDGDMIIDRQSAELLLDVFRFIDNDVHENAPRVLESEESIKLFNENRDEYGKFSTGMGHAVKIGGLGFITVAAATTALAAAGILSSTEKEEPSDSSMELDVVDALFKTFPGQDDPLYADGIKKLSENSNDQDAIKELSKSLGISPAEIKNQLALIDKYKQDDVVKLSPDSDHWGSREQLLFGHTVAKNLDPKLNGSMAVLLSPTGGIVGPGSVDLSNVAGSFGIDENIIKVHAAVHDAAGFLFNKFGKGPGYNYQGGSLYKGLPISGQFKGYSFWKTAQNSLQYAATHIEDGVERLEEVIKLFNPYHDKIGKFAEVKGAPSAEILASSKMFAENKARMTPGKIIKTTGKVLGLTALTGVVGIAALATLAAVENANSDADELGVSTDPEERKKQLEADLVQKEAELAEFTANWPKSADQESAKRNLINAAKEAGFEMPIDPSIEVTSLPQGIGGYYLPDSNTLQIAPKTAELLASGDPHAVHMVMHELLHTNQEIDNMGDALSGISKDSNPNNFVDMLEGQNDLATMVATSSIYKDPMSNGRVVELSNQYDKKVSNIIGIKTSLAMVGTVDKGDTMLGGGKGTVTVLGGTTISGNTRDISSVGYNAQASTYAGLVTEYANATNSNPNTVLATMHKDGFRAVSHHDMLVTLFPNEMINNNYYVEKSAIAGTISKMFGGNAVERRFPSQPELRKWMENHNYVDPDKALDQMLEERAR